MADDTHIKITVPIPVQTLRDILCTAVEGGSNYWAEFPRTIARAANGDYLSVIVVEQEASRPNGVRVRRTIKAEDLAEGIARLAIVMSDDSKSHGFPAAGKHFADAFDNHDATTADVVLQMTIFGELVYG